MGEHHLRDAAEVLKEHRKAAVIGLGAITVGTSAIVLGTRAILHKRHNLLQQGVKPLEFAFEAYAPKLVGFENVSRTDARLRASIFKIAALIYVATKDDQAASVTPQYIRDLRSVDSDQILPAFAILNQFVGTPQQPNLFGERENLKRVAGEGAPKGLYVLALPFPLGREVQEAAPDFSQAIGEQLAIHDALIPQVEK